MLGFGAYGGLGFCTWGLGFGGGLGSKRVRVRGPGFPEPLLNPPKP